LKEEKERNYIFIAEHIQKTFRTQTQTHHTLIFSSVHMIGIHVYVYITSCSRNLLFSPT